MNLEEKRKYPHLSFYINPTYLARIKPGQIWGEPQLLNCSNDLGYFSCSNDLGHWKCVHGSSSGPRTVRETTKFPQHSRNCTYNQFVKFKPWTVQWAEVIPNGCHNLGLWKAWYLVAIFAPRNSSLRRAHGSNGLALHHPCNSSTSKIHKVMRYYTITTKSGNNENTFGELGRNWRSLQNTIRRPEKSPMNSQACRYHRLKRVQCLNRLIRHEFWVIYDAGHKIKRWGKKAMVDTEIVLNQLKQ